MRKDRILSPNSIFIFMFLILFPFGQIIRLHFELLGYSIPLHPVDIVVGLGAVYFILFQKSKPKILNYLIYFLTAAIFSYLISIFVFRKEVFYGLFYLIRLASYILYIGYVWNFTRKSKFNKKLLTDSLVLISSASAFFGWLQFFIYPDLKPFTFYGWDMHLYRLAGTFMDPTYLGLIIVFGLLLVIYKYFDTRNKKYIFLSIFLAVSLAFTYSRASYLAFLAGVTIMSLKQKSLRKIIAASLAILFIAFLLPNAKNHSIELNRIFSVVSRLKNYSEGMEIFKKFPVFGVGYDNLCIARNKYIVYEPFSSHACSGSDSSIITILATMGVIGLMVLIGSVIDIYKSLIKNSHALIVIATFWALFIHSFFSNSLFFPWVMGYMGILLTVSIKE